jgi:hypothetical protein
MQHLAKPPFRAHLELGRVGEQRAWSREMQKE